MELQRVIVIALAIVHPPDVVVAYSHQMIHTQLIGKNGQRFLVIIQCLIVLTLFTMRLPNVVVAAGYMEVFRVRLLK